MRNKKMIIISITSIIIIALALIGITFGYYLTKINGNENNKSVSVESANREVEIKEIETIETGVIKEGTTKIIEPGYENIKIFTVQNIGNTEATYHIYLDEVKNTFNRTQDITYTLYRKSGNNTIDTDNLSDSDIISTGTFPKNNSYILTNETITSPNDYYTYALKVTYINSTTEDQTEDQGKTFSYKIQLHAEINLPKLADTIINNAKLSTNGTTYSPTPLTNPAEEVSGETEKTLSVTEDDLGTSYYYRGSVTDNYVNFAGMCWRIVRIEGDGSTKLILEDYNTTCNSSSFTGNWSDGNTYTFGSLEASNFIGGSLATAFKTFQTSKLVTDTVDYTTKLKSGDWCFDDTVTETSSYGFDDNYNAVYTESEATNGWYTDEYYGAYTRIYTDKKPSLNCTGTKLTKYKDGTDMYVATLTADEISFAGASSSVNYNYYLMNDYTKNNYLYWWALSPYYYLGEDGDDRAFLLVISGLLSYDYVDSRLDSARPAVSLKSSAVITSGDGTKNNPYEIG